MIKKTINYTDYNGVERTEDYYFNLSKPEIAEMELSIPEGLHDYIQNAIAKEDKAALLKLYKMFIINSVGIKSEDGKRFIKNETITDSFRQSEAYTELFMELITDEKKATEFLEGLVPADTIKKPAVKA